VEAEAKTVRMDGLIHRDVVTLSRARLTRMTAARASFGVGLQRHFVEWPELSFLREARSVRYSGTPNQDVGCPYILTSFL
jgi:hypothetical protein